jgi:hypothetical protein
MRDLFLGEDETYFDRLCRSMQGSIRDAKERKRKKAVSGKRAATVKITYGQLLASLLAIITAAH